MRAPANPGYGMPDKLLCVEGDVKNFFRCSPPDGQTGFSRHAWIAAALALISCDRKPSLADPCFCGIQ
jgi:hypothetical protein